MPNLGLAAFFTTVSVNFLMRKLVPVHTPLSAALGIPGPAGSALSPTFVTLIASTVGTSGTFFRSIFSGPSSTTVTLVDSTLFVVLGVGWCIARGVFLLFVAGLRGGETVFLGVGWGRWGGVKGRQGEEGEVYFFYCEARFVHVFTKRDGGERLFLGYGVG